MSEILAMEQVAPALIKRINSLVAARIVFVGFTLPEEFGEGNELQFGNLNQLASIGLRENAVEMGRFFVKKTIEDLFSGEFGPCVPEETMFRLTEEEEGVLTVSAVSSAE